jgi:hypothetical protein
VFSCDTSTNTGRIRVRYTGDLSSATNTTVQIHTDGSSLEPDADSAFGSNRIYKTGVMYAYPMGATTDDIGLGRALSLTGAPSATTGQIDDAYSFNGTSQSAAAPFASSGWEVPGGFANTGLAYIPDDDLLVIGDFTNSKLIYTDRWGNKHSEITIDSQPQGVAYDSSDDTLWWSDRTNKYIRHIQRDGTKLASDDIDVSTMVTVGPNGLTYEAATDSLWFTNDEGEVIRVSCSTGAEQESYSISGYSNLDGCHYDAPSDRLWLSDDTDSRLVIVNASTGSVVGFVATGNDSVEDLVLVGGVAYVNHDDELHSSTPNGNRVRNYAVGSTAADFAVGAWINVESATSADAILGTLDPVGGRGWGLFATGTTNLRPWISGTANENVFADRTITSGWHRVWLTFDWSADEMRLYVDGSQSGATISTSALGATPNVFGLAKLTIAGLIDPADKRHADVLVEDVLLLESSPGADWITTEYNNQSDPSSFYTATDPNAGGGVSVAVPAASVTITGYAPTVTGAASISVDVPAGEISVTGYAPTVTSTDNIEVAIPADSLTVTGYAPTVTASDSQEVSPGADSIAVTGYAPTIAITDAQAIVIPAGSVTVTGYAPTVETTSSVTVEVDTGSVSITGHAPAVGTSISVSPAVSTLSITGYAPSVVASVKTVTCTLVDVNGRALPNLADLSYAWFDEPDPANLSTPVVKGVTESTDGSGVIEVPISGSSLTSGQTGLLVLRSSDGESLGAYNLPVA